MTYGVGRSRDPRIRMSRVGLARLQGNKMRRKDIRYIRYISILVGILEYIRS